MPATDGNMNVYNSCIVTFPSIRGVLVGHFDPWKRGHHDVSKRRNPITHWRSVVSQKNWIPVLITVRPVEGVALNEQPLNQPGPK